MLTFGQRCGEKRLHAHANQTELLSSKEDVWFTHSSVALPPCTYVIFSLICLSGAPLPNAEGGASIFMMNELVNSALVDEAYQWLCQQRKNFPVNSDVWDVRFHWSAVKTTLMDELSTNTFHFEPLQKITTSNGEVLHVWTSVDSLVLKLLSIVLHAIYRHLRCVLT